MTPPKSRISGNDDQLVNKIPLRTFQDVRPLEIPHHGTPHGMIDISCLMHKSLSIELGDSAELVSSSNS